VIGQDTKDLIGKLLARKNTISWHC
jgi:hypothetical protein